MKWTKISAILLVLAFCFGCKDKTTYYDPDSDTFEIVDEPIEQTHLWGWGKIPKQNLCPHCGAISFKRFCTECKKERGNLPFISVYCPKCDPCGKYPSLTENITEICADCGSDRTWKYIYKDWQTKPEPNEPTYLSIYNRALSAEEIAEIDRKLSEPKEPKPKPLNPILNKNHPLSEGLTGFELFIPTWPDYIELEKELCIDMPYGVRVGIGYSRTETWRFPKGTKIYFRDD